MRLRQPTFGVPASGAPSRSAAAERLFELLEAAPGWHNGYVPRPLGLDFDDLPHERWNAWLAQSVAERAATPAGAAEAEAVWARSIEELDKGLCDGPWEATDLDGMIVRRRVLARHPPFRRHAEWAAARA